MSRGKSVNEDDLYGWLLNNKDATGIVDVFRKEPYSGPLTSLENAILTPHIASSTLSSRRGMETGAAVNAAEFLRGEND
jgi:D-3-phosphoglycerate dehydrogenase